MKKVYCKNCKWGGDWFANLIDYGDVKGWLWCDYYKRNGDLINEEFTGMKKREIGHPTRKNELNSNGECPNYKRKWWKFWIK